MKTQTKEVRMIDLLFSIGFAFMCVRVPTRLLAAINIDLSNNLLFMLVGISIFIYVSFNLYKHLEDNSL